MKAYIKGTFLCFDCGGAMDSVGWAMDSIGTKILYCVNEECKQYGVRYEYPTIELKKAEDGSYTRDTY